MWSTTVAVSTRPSASHMAHSGYLSRYAALALCHALPYPRSAVLRLSVRQLFWVLLRPVAKVIALSRKSLRLALLDLFKHQQTGDQQDPRYRDSIDLSLVHHSYAKLRLPAPAQQPEETRPLLPSRHWLLRLSGPLTAYGHTLHRLCPWPDGQVTGWMVLGVVMGCRAGTVLIPQCRHKRRCGAAKKKSPDALLCQGFVIWLRGRYTQIGCRTFNACGGRC